MPPMDWCVVKGDKHWFKSCTRCKEEFWVEAEDAIKAYDLMRENFSISDRHDDGLQRWCLSCQANYSNNRSNKDFHRDIILNEQDGKCKLCDKPISFKNRTAIVDHNHVSGKTRGVLCYRCNTWMAAIDDIEWIKKANTYRELYECA